MENIFSQIIGFTKENLKLIKWIFNYNDERIYEGEFKNNKMNDLGLFKWNDGRKFFGLFENDIRNGFGIYF